MVRADTTETSEDTSKKKVSPSKKNVAGGIWPCKINGCNKQFAREADLKRHQKTTKMHSMPGFLCPQCDATFTRTDALRRHQKSRHNGVIIEPTEQGMKEGDEENHSFDSQSSRSGTPSIKGKERAAPTTLPVQTHQGLPTATGPSSYYRSHTMTMSSHVPQRPTYAQMGQPDPSTRLNLTHTWSYPWPGGPSPPHLMVALNYPHIPPSAMYYHPNPHYRPNGATTFPPVPPPPLQMPSNAQASSSNGSSSAVPSPVSDHPPIDGLPDIDSSISAASQLTTEAVHSALAALVKSAQEEAKATSSASGAPKMLEETQNDSGKFYIEGEAPISSSSSTIKDEASQASLEEHADPDETSKQEEGHSVVSSLSLEDTLNGMHGYGPPLDRPEPMEHLLTEDGEPMLNPAELLTQESLASPPPS